MTRPSACRAEIFTALAADLDIPRVLARFQLQPKDLQTLFQEAADYYQKQDDSVWTLHFDGASRGNPGPAGAGVVLQHPNLPPYLDYRYLGETTNNVAEYQALLLGLALARRHRVIRLRVFGDSELVVKQLNGVYQVKSPHLHPLWLQAKKELQKFQSYAISHVGRELNSQADQLARLAIDQGLASR